MTATCWPAATTCCTAASAGPDPTSNIQVTGNRFSNAFYPRGGFYGPVAHFRPGDPENIWYGNFWDDTLAPVPAP